MTRSAPSAGSDPALALRAAHSAEVRAVRMTLAYILLCIIVTALVRFYDGLAYQDDSANDGDEDVMDARFMIDSRHEPTDR